MDIALNVGIRAGGNVQIRSASDVVPCVEETCERDGCNFRIHRSGTNSFHCVPCHGEVVVEKLKSTIRALEEDKRKSEEDNHKSESDFEAERGGYLRRISELELRIGNPPTGSQNEGTAVNRPPAPKKARLADAAGSINTPSPPLNVSPPQVTSSPFCMPLFGDEDAANP